MSLIERMSILGIRSFGHESPQKIDFSPPVTLILGQNGTGKTTIIECLKYACTGDLPPGSKTGCSFIHDPRLARETEVRAKVTLQIRDVRGQPMVVSRAMVATQRDKAKQGTMKTLDGSIKRQLPDGRIASISSKCAEIDTEMVTSLGVSKAVLENVIFCHQELSNWPLQEAKAVKQRFDDLFASSRYVKALDAMRKCKQEKDHSIKIYKTELKHLSKSREEAVKLRCEKEELQQNVTKQEASLDQVTEKLTPISERLNMYKKRYAELIDLQAEIKTYETKKAHLEESIANLLSNIKHEFEGTSEQLAILVEDASAEFERKQLNLTRLEESLKLNRIKLRDAETQRNQLSVEIAQLETRVKQLTEASDTRENLLRSIAQQYIGSVDFNVPSDGTRFTDGQIEEFVKTFRRFVRDEDGNESGLKNQLRKADLEDDALVNKAVNELARVEEQCEETRKRMRELTNELTGVKRQLEEAKTIASQIEAYRSEMAQAESRVAQLEASEELSEARKRLSGITTEKQCVEQELHKLDDQISQQHRDADQLRELAALRKDRDTKFEAARKIRSRQLDSLEQLFADTPVPPILSNSTIEQTYSTDSSRSSFGARSDDQSRLRPAFVTCLTRVEQATRETRKRLAACEQKRSVLETQTKNSRSRLQEKQSQAQRLEEQVLTVAGTADLEQCLAKLQDRRKVLEEECSNEQGSLFLWRKFRDRLARPEPDCPVCHRDLSDRSEQAELIAEIDQRIHLMPGEFAQKKSELIELVAKHESLLQLKPTSAQLAQLRSEEIPQLETRLQTELEQLHKAREASSGEQARLDSLQADESLAKSIQGDLAVLERLENERIDVIRKLKQLNVDELDAGTDGESLETLQEKRKELRTKQTALSTKSNQCQESIDRLDRIQRQATTELHRIKDLVFKLEQENQANVRRTETMGRLNAEIDQNRSRLTQLETTDLLTRRSGRDAATNSKRERALTRERQLEQSAEKTRKLHDLLKQIEHATTAVASASMFGSQETLRGVQRRLDQADTTVRHLQPLIDQSAEQLEAARRELNEHKIRQRELADCVQLRQLRNQLGQLALQMREMSERLSKLNAVAGANQDLVKETKRLSVEEERILAQKHAVNNQLGQLTAKLQYLERDLKEKYAESDREYLDMMYQLRTTELACSDLERYYKALDRAILAYHASKMTDLNKIIRELWRSTYRGNDIDYIEICSEEEDGATANAARSRRTYNYRVVMVKTTSGLNAAATSDQSNRRSATAHANEACLDMRGRCSAGQKVLASLIIRLALAEVFCLHCGVLALDEPTTNLDRENIESLAHALVEIIKDRQRQKNFQLIVITHDEDFVELLGRSDFVDNFFLLSRNPQGLSEIRKVPIEEHFH